MSLKSGMRREQKAYIFLNMHFDHHHGSFHQHKVSPPQPPKQILFPSQSIHTYGTLLRVFVFHSSQFLSQGKRKMETHRGYSPQITSTQSGFQHELAMQRVYMAKVPNLQHVCVQPQTRPFPLVSTICFLTALHQHFHICSSLSSIPTPPACFCFDH